MRALLWSVSIIRGLCACLERRLAPAGWMATAGFRQGEVMDVERDGTGSDRKLTLFGFSAGTLPLLAWGAEE